MPKQGTTRYKRWDTSNVPHLLYLAEGDQPPPISPVVSTTKNSPFMWGCMSHQKGY